MMAIGIISGLIALMLASLAAIELGRGKAKFLFIPIDRQTKPKLFWFTLILRFMSALFFAFLTFTSFTITGQCDDDGRCKVTLPVAPK
jgi:hypothetical protein